MPRGHALFQHRIGSFQSAIGFGDAGRVFFSLRTQSICNPLLHAVMDVQIEKTVPLAGLERGLRVSWDQDRFGRVILLQVFDDDGGFRHRGIPLCIVQHRHFADRPVAGENRIFLGATGDGVLLERGLRLVERQQDFPAI